MGRKAATHHSSYEQTRSHLENSQTPRRFKPLPYPATPAGMTKRTPQRETAVIQAFASGKTITVACKENGIGRTTFQEWRRADPDLNRRFEEAQREHAEALIDQSMEIAENPSSDWARDHGSGGDGDADGRDHIRHARLRIDTRLRVARILLNRHDAAVERRLREEARAEQAKSMTARHVSPRASERDSAAEAEPETDDEADYLYPVSILEEACARIDRGEDPFVPPPPRHLRNPDRAPALVAAP